jgi:hypothetical protein
MMIAEPITESPDAVRVAVTMAKSLFRESGIDMLRNRREVDHFLRVVLALRSGTTRRATNVAMVLKAVA